MAKIKCLNKYFDTGYTPLLLKYVKYPNKAIALKYLSVTVLTGVTASLCIHNMLSIVVCKLATQTGGVIVNNIFEVTFTYTKID